MQRETFPSVDRGSMYLYGRIWEAPHESRPERKYFQAKQRGPEVLVIYTRWDEDDIRRVRNRLRSPRQRYSRAVINGFEDEYSNITRLIINVLLLKNTKRKVYTLTRELQEILIKENSNLIEEAKRRYAHEYPEDFLIKVLATVAYYTWSGDIGKIAERLCGKECTFKVRDRILETLAVLEVYKNTGIWVGEDIIRSIADALWERKER